MTTPNNYFGPHKGAFPDYIRVGATELAYDNQKAGEAVNQYDVVYLDGDFWRRADANSVPAVPQTGIGMAVASAASGALGLRVWHRGILSNGAWAFVSGASIFLASGLGQTPTMSAPSASGNHQYILGRTLTSTAMQFDPRPPIQVGQ